MRNILGDNLTLTLFGESHGPLIGAVLDGMQAGIKVDEDFIKLMLSKRRPQKDIETNRVEMDDFEIVSGVFEGYKDFDVKVIVDNDVVNYCKVVRKGSDFYDEVVNAYNNGENEIDSYYIEVARPDKDLYLIRYNG